MSKTKSEGSSSVLKSDGSKRVISSALSVGSAVASSVPGLGVVTSVLQPAAGVVGAVGVGHAVAAKTLTEHKLNTISAILASILALSPFIPWLAPAVAILGKLTTIFAAAGVGASLTSSTKEK